MSFLTNIKSLWIIILILVILNVVSVGTIWFSREHRPISRLGISSRSERGTQQPRDRHFLTKELNFTADQQVKFDTLAASHKANLNIKTDEIRVLREQLVSRMKNREFDSVSEDLIHQIGQKQAELELINFRNFRDVMNICDDNQKDRFLGIMQRAFKPRYDNHGRNRNRK